MKILLLGLFAFLTSSQISQFFKAFLYCSIVLPWNIFQYILSFHKLFCCSPHRKIDIKFCLCYVSSFIQILFLLIHIIHKLIAIRYNLGIIRICVSNSIYLSSNPIYPVHQLSSCRSFFELQSCSLFYKVYIMPYPLSNCSEHFNNLSIASLLCDVPSA